MSKEHTIQEVCGELAKTIKGKVDKFASEVEAMRKAEVSRSQKGKKLAKTELCPLCGNPDRPGSCQCTLAKSGMGTAAPDAPPTAQGAPSLNMSEMCGTHGKDLAKCGPACGMKKDEKDATKFKAPIGPAKGSKLPDDAKSKKVDAGEGTGGAISKGKGLSKAMPAAKPKITGTPGQQPVGMGGGDAKPGAPTSVAQANKELGASTSIAKSPTAMPTGSPPAMGVGPRLASAKASTIPTGKPVAAPATGLPAPLQGVRDKLNLQADMKAGGVGWLQRKRAAAGPAPTLSAPPAGGSAFGPTSKRGTGIATSQAALARGEKSATKMEGPAPTEGFNSINHNRRMLKVGR